MPAYKDEKSGTWNAQFRYTDWTGERKRKLKRGFERKKDAEAWEREFLMQKHANLDMTFESFVERYEADMKPKLKYNTWRTKEQIIRNRILPYFKDKKMSEIKPSDVLSWQNTLLNEVDADGNRLSKTYLKTIHNQLSAIFNHAWRFYGLHDNPARKAGNMGCEETKEMLFWTKEEYLQFSDSMMDKEVSFHAFEMLYWTGIRLGELLALTPSDFDFEKKTLSITKSYQRIDGQDDDVRRKLAPLQPLINSVLDTEGFKKSIEAEYMYENERDLALECYMENVREQDNKNNRENTRQEER